MTELTDTLNNGETEVLVVPKGEFYGSDSKGNPIQESIDEKVIDSLEEQLRGKELLVDKDHSSVKEGDGRDTSAMGWMHSFKKGVEGLWAKIRWTNIGKNLVENRVFRFLSPVFTLKGDKPTNMLNVALTNQPAFQEKAKPIINNKPNMEEIEMTMTKEELVSLIKETIADMNTEPAKVEKKTEDTEKVSKMVAENACSDDKVEKPVEKAEQVTDEVKQDVKEEIQEGKAEGKTPEEIKKEVKEEIAEEKAEAEQVSKKEDVEEKKDEEKTDSTTSELDKTDDPEDKEEKEEDDEVIKIEALNSTPKTFGLDVVKNTGVGHRKLEYPEQGYAIVTKVN